MIFVDWISEHFYEVLILYLFVRYNRKLVFLPLAGGNGHVQLDELAKGVILGAFALSAKAEASRVQQWQIFPDSYWYALLGAVILIAGLKQGAELFNRGKERGTTEAAPL